MLLKMVCMPPVNHNLPVIMLQRGILTLITNEIALTLNL